MRFFTSSALKGAAAAEGNGVVAITAAFVSATCFGSLFTSAAANATVVCGVAAIVAGFASAVGLVVTVAAGGVAAARVGVFAGTGFTGCASFSRAATRACGPVSR